MSQEDVQVILDQYEATNARDFPRAMSFYAEDVELVAREPFLKAGHYEGREAVGDFFGDWFSAFENDARFDVKEARDLPTGDVLLVADHHARGRASGVEVRQTIVWVYGLEDGLIKRVEGYPSREAALEAAGASE